MDSLDLLVKKRIYVGNLPFETTEDDIRSKFSEFGNIIKIELKHRSDASFDMGLPCYAFLDLKIKSNSVDACFKKLSQKKWGNNDVKLEIARESLLSRLEKERNDVNENDTFNKTTETIMYGSEKNNTTNSNHKKQKNREMAQLKVDVYSSSSSRNKSRLLSPITLNSHSKQINVDQGNASRKTSTPIAKDTSWKNNINSKQLDSEEKRLNSLEERKKFNLQQKDAVKLALSSVDQFRPNNRVVFDEDVGMDIPETSTSRSKSSTSAHSSRNKPSLFNDDGDDPIETVEFNIKKQFEGKKGQKLLELQSNYANDQRFSLDERFYDSDDGEEVMKNDIDLSPPHEEYKRQMEILDSIIGSDLPKHVEKKDPRKANNFMLRFDPAIAEHEKYVIKVVPKPPIQSEPHAKNKKLKRAEIDKRKDDQAPTATVASKEKFYKVSDNLRESLKSSENSGFSLLKMFGANTEKSDESEDNAEVPMTRPPRDVLEWTTNPFKYDSSESEEDEATREPAPEPTQQSGIGRESFFFKHDDSRLSDALAFFSVKSNSAEDFDQRRRELRQIIVAKVKHNIRKSQMLQKKLGGKRLNKFQHNKGSFNN